MSELRTLVPTLTQEGAPLSLDCDEIADGVKGYAMQVGREVWIPLIYASRPGNGDVGRFLDRLHPACRIVNVGSIRLQSILTAKGWTRGELDGVDVWRPPIKSEETR